MKKTDRYIYSILISALLLTVTDLCAQNKRVYHNYMINRLQKGLNINGFKGQDTIQHFFLEFNGGPTFSLIQGLNKEVQTPGFELGIALGRWFTPVNGFRLGVFGKRYNSSLTGEKIQANSWGINLDYLANFSALGNEFNPVRRFEMLGIIGGEYSFSKHSGNNYRNWGIRTGLQARYAMDHGSVFYIEPRIGIYSDNLDYTSNWRKYDIAGSILVGVEFRTFPSSMRYTHRFRSSKFKDHYFMFSGMGLGSLITKGNEDISKYSGGGFFLGIGRWLTPYSGIRITGKACTFNYPVADKVKSIGFQADWMLNLTHTFYGYNPNKKFELIAIAGMSYDSVSNNTKKNLFGLGASLQASVKLTRDISCYVEPRINYYPGKDYAAGANGENKCRANFLINAGIQITSNPAERGTTEESVTTKRFSNYNFFGGAYGLNSPLLQASLFQKNSSSRITGFIGRCFSKTSGVRLSADIGKLWKSSDQPDVQTSTVGLDFLWNITSYMNGYDPKRIFEIFGAIGPNMAFRSSQPGSSCYLGGECSLQGLWNITPSVGISIEPQLRLYPDSFSEGSISLGKLDGIVNIMAGIRYKF